LRTVGLSSSAPEKLARLLLGWSQNGQTTESGTRFHFTLTHEEIGEFIGTSRETVTRTLTEFKHRRLVACHGATLTIRSRMALETYARG
jgi:CRP/FNR family transcriptional regulator